MPRCVSDADAKRPCTKRATQRALARFVNPLTASKMRSTMPSASRSHHPTSGHAAQEQRQLPHAIAMATHTDTPHAASPAKTTCPNAVQPSVVAITKAAHGSSPRPRRTAAATVSAPPSSMAAKSSVGAATTNAATMDGRTVHIATHSCEEP